MFTDPGALYNRQRRVEGTTGKAGIGDVQVVEVMGFAVEIRTELAGSVPNCIVPFW